MLGSFQCLLLLWPLFVWTQHPSLLHLLVCTTYDTSIHTQSNIQILKKAGSLNSTCHFFQIDYFGLIVRKIKVFQVGCSLGRMNKISSLCLKSLTSQLQGMVLNNFSHLKYTQYEQFEGHRYAFYPSAIGAWSPVPTLEATLQGAGAVWHLTWQVTLEASYSLHTDAVSFLQTFPVLVYFWNSKCLKLVPMVAS